MLQNSVKMSGKLGILFFIILFYRNVESAPRVDPLVETKVGLIRGLRATDGEYSMFLGIPFGKIDEDNPFGLSTPYPPFNETFEAYDDSAICPQIEEFTNTIVGDPDCLHLNIYVPASANSKNRLPVLVWIYGGGFTIGFGGRTLYGPKYLVRHDIILVTLNYRLGPYGFMYLDTPEVPGNQGLKDQLLALRWIKNNIESFGGNANKITIFGESAGGMSVDAHLISQQEKLFNAVIIQSGTSLTPGLTGDSDPMAPVKLAELLGLNVNDASQALRLISSVDPKLLIAAASHMDDTKFWPCVEKDFENVEKFITDYPINLNVPKAKNMPILIGFNAEEWFSNHANKTDDYYETWNGIYDQLSQAFDFEDNKLAEMEELVRRFYIGDESFSADVRHKLAEFDSDFKFDYPTERSIDKYIDNGAANVFYYVFSYVGERNWVRRHNNITIGGALHADEIGYLFDVSLWKEQPTPEDQLIIDRITTLWTNFVKYGDPTPETTDLLPIKWEPVTSKKSHYFLTIDTELKVEKRPYHERMAFWDLFYNLNQKHQEGYKEN